MHVLNIVYNVETNETNVKLHLLIVDIKENPLLIQYTVYLNCTSGFCPFCVKPSAHVRQPRKINLKKKTVENVCWYLTLSLLLVLPLNCFRFGIKKKRKRKYKTETGHLPVVNIVPPLMKCF